MMVAYRTVESQATPRCQEAVQTSETLVVASFSVAALEVPDAPPAAGSVKI